MRQIIHEHKSCKSYIAILEDETVIYNIGTDIYGNNQTVEEFIESLENEYQVYYNESKLKMIKAFDINKNDQERLNQLNEIKENLYKKSNENKSIVQIIHEHKAFGSYIAILEDKTVIYKIGNSVVSSETLNKLTVKEFINCLQKEYESVFQKSRNELNHAFDVNKNDQERLNQLNEIKKNLYK